jgi:hypothetical protein
MVVCLWRRVMVDVSVFERGGSIGAGNGQWVVILFLAHNRAITRVERWNSNNGNLISYLYTCSKRREERT